MLYTVLILLKESGILLFEERIKDIDYDSKLFSGLLSAVQSLCLEINIGECNTFSSEEFTVLTSSTNNIVIALIIKKSDPFIESFWKNLSLDIGKKFEEIYDLSNFKGKVSIFDNFNQILHEILAEREIY